MKLVLLSLASLLLHFANVCSGEEVEKEWTLVLLTEAAKQGAVCLDGSAPGYYFRPGYGSGANKWHLHLKGGAMCQSLHSEECVKMTDNGKGTSELYPPYLPTPNPSKEVQGWRMDGILSGDPSVNPDFYNWNTAYIMSCEKSEFASNLEEPVEIPARNGKEPTTLYFRGKRVLQANLDDLLESGMKDASDVLLGGGASGAQAVFLHADYVGQQLPSHIRYSAISDGGFILDHRNKDGLWASRFKYIKSTMKQNRTGSFDQDCVEAYGQKDAWKCHFPQYTYPYVTTPMFTVMPKYDHVGIEIVLGMGCVSCQTYSYCLDDCSEEEMERIHAYSEDQTKWIAEQVWDSPTDGMFLDSCLTHSQTHEDDQWAVTSVNGQTLQETVGIWYFGREGNSKVVEDCQFPCNPSCTPDLLQLDSSDQEAQPDGNQGV